MRYTIKHLRSKVEHLQSKGYDIGYDRFMGRFRMTNKSGSANFTNLSNIGMCLAWIEGFMHGKDVVGAMVRENLTQFLTSKGI